MFMVGFYTILAMITILLVLFALVNFSKVKHEKEEYKPAKDRWIDNWEAKTKSELQLLVAAQKRMLDLREDENTRLLEQKGTLEELLVANGILTPAGQKAPYRAGQWREEADENLLLT